MLRTHRNFQIDDSKPSPTKKKKQWSSSPVALGFRRAKDEEEAKLESTVLGGVDHLLNSLSEVKNVSQSGHDEISSNKHEQQGILDRERLKPVWQDEDDIDKIITQDTSSKSAKTKERNKGKDLQSKFEKIIGPKPEWAKLKSEKETQSDGDSEDSDDSDDGDFIPLSRRTGTYLTQSVALPKCTLDYRPVLDVNSAKRTKRAVTALEFHKTAQLALVAGFDQTLNLFQIDGEHNPKIQSIFLEKFPIFSAHFTADGNEVIMSSQFKWFHNFDMMTGKVTQTPYIRGLSVKSLTKFCVSPDGSLLAFRGKFGMIYLVSAKSKEYVATLKMNGEVGDFVFSADSSRLLSFGTESYVYVWDIKSRRCVHKFEDEGGMRGTTISMSDNGQFIATGSESGIVNIYNEDCFKKTSPKPIKTVPNLITGVSAAKFAPSNEILGVVSRFDDHAMKLIHLPSCHVFANIGDERQSYAKCFTTMDFSPNNGYLSIGTITGRALLFRLNHYSNY